MSPRALCACGVVLPLRAPRCCWPAPWGSVTRRCQAGAERWDPRSHLFFPGAGAGFLPALKGIYLQRGEGWEDLGAAPSRELCVCIAAIAGSCLQTALSTM